MSQDGNAIIDAQVHCYERDRPERPWTAVLHGPPEVTGDDMVVAMDEVGVDGALLVSPYTMYRFDESYALEVYASHPTRFGLIKPVDSSDPGVGDTIEAWADVAGAVAIRIMMVGSVPTDPDDPGLNRVLQAAGASGLPVNLLCWGRLPTVAGLAARNPNTRLVVDHLGLQQPFEPPGLENPFGELPSVLELADQDNVVIKITGACTLSNQGYPYDDLWPFLSQIFDSYGFDRCLWGTDWTRAVELLTYAQGVEPFRLTDTLSESERARLMGGTAAAVYDWTPG